jgi:predicted nucleotidyltransferase
MNDAELIDRFSSNLDLLVSETEKRSEQLMLIEQSIKLNLGKTLGRTVHSAGSQLLGLLMFDSDLDVAVAVNNQNDLNYVLEILESANFEYEPYTDKIYDDLHFGVCYSVMEGIKIDVQLRSNENIAQLETQIANLPKWSSDEITRLRKKKILARAIGGATYVNWKHDIYRNHLPALILSTSRRTSEEMCQSHNTLLHGQCTKRSSKRSLCDLHQSEVI